MEELNYKKHNSSLILNIMFGPGAQEKDLEAPSRFFCYL